MLSTIIYTREDWNIIWGRVKDQNPTSISISWVMRKKLGLEIIKKGGEVRAVFDNEQKKTMFLLKYAS